MRSGRGTSLESLLREMRSLEIDVEVADRVLSAVAGLAPGGEHRPSFRQVAWSVAASALVALAALAGLASAVLSVPPGSAEKILALGRSLGLALGAIGRESTAVLASIGEAILALLRIAAIPAGGGRLLLHAATGVGAGCFVALILATTALLWRDLRAATTLDSRRTP